MRHIMSPQMQTVNTQVPSVCLELVFLVAKKCSDNHNQIQFCLDFQILRTVFLFKLCYLMLDGLQHY